MSFSANSLLQTINNLVAGLNVIIANLTTDLNAEKVKITSLEARVDALENV
jgi:hypothetical protein